MFKLMLVLHLLGAAIWTGGHLVLALGILPGALRQRSIAPIQAFEAVYERIGLPALLMQVGTGFWLLQRLFPSHAAWVDVSTPWGQLIALKFVLLAATIGLALDARLRLIPRLDESRLTSLAWHIAGVTTLSVLFVVVGAGFRTGGLF